MKQPCTRSAKTLKKCRKREVTINSWYGKTDMKTRPYRSMGPKTKELIRSGFINWNKLKSAIKREIQSPADLFGPNKKYPLYKLVI